MNVNLHYNNIKPYLTKEKCKRFLKLLLTDVRYCGRGDPKSREEVQGRKSCSSSDSWVKIFGRNCNRSFEGCHRTAFNFQKMLSICN